MKETLNTFFECSCLSEVDPLVLNIALLPRKTFKDISWLRGKKKISELPKYAELNTKYYIGTLSGLKLSEMLLWVIEETHFNWCLTEIFRTSKAVKAVNLLLPSQEALIMTKLKWG